MFMRPFSLTWTAEILEDEALVFVSTVQEALELAWEHLPAEGHIVPAPEVRPFGDWVLQGADPETEYGSFQWYQDRAAVGGARVLRADRFLNLILDEPWQQDAPHYDLSLVHQPLIDGAGHTTLGLALRGRAAVLSVHLIRRLTDARQRSMLLRRVVAHYVGQAMAVPIAGVRSPGARNEAHCRNICAMRPADSLPMLLAFSEQEADVPVLYCEPCQIELGQRIVGAHLGNN
jgi:hypothetical protein